MKPLSYGLQKSKKFAFIFVYDLKICEKQTYIQFIANIGGLIMANNVVDIGQQLYCAWSNQFAFL